MTRASSTRSHHLAHAARFSLFIHHAIARSTICRMSSWSRMKFCHRSHAALRDWFMSLLTNPAILNRCSTSSWVLSRQV